MWHRLRGDRWRGSEGASGAIYASLAFYGALFPNTTFLLFFIVPMPAWVMIGGIFAVS
jgi:membrane associated rhomboid family serine protease